MHSYTYLNKRQRKTRRLFLFFLIITSLIVLVVIIDGKMRPVIEGALSAEASRAATRMINEAVAAELEDEKISYNDIVQIERDKDNSVTSIETNIKEINLLKARLNNRVLDSLEESDERMLRISLGTLTGNEFFFGRGPRFRYSIEVHGMAETAFLSSFEAVGINQTRHRIYIEVTASITGYMPGYNAKATVKTTVIAAETVIVGKIPTYYSDYNRLLDKNIVP